MQDLQVYHVYVCACMCVWCVRVCVYTCVRVCERACVCFFQSSFGKEKDNLTIVSTKSEKYKLTASATARGVGARWGQYLFRGKIADT